MINLLRSLQFADSAFPIGGYAFSSGLESAAKTGLIRDVETLERYLRNFLTQTVCSEIPYVNSAFKHAGPGCADLEQVFVAVDSFLTIPALRHASVTQGRSLLAVCRSTYPDYAVTEGAEWIRSRRLTPHYSPTFGLVAGLIELTGPQTAMSYLYIGMRDQICAAVRLGMLGPRQGQRVLGGLLEEIAAHAERAIALEYHQSFRIAAVLEIAQAGHATLYSRLFQS